MDSGFRLSIKISRAIEPDKGACGVMYLTVQRTFVHLEDELRQTFACDPSTKIIVNQRIEDRRKLDTEVAVDRRMAQRRRPKEEMIEMLISV